MQTEGQCPFCALKHLTKWYYFDEDNIVVCLDLDPKKYKARLLVVGSGKGYHLGKESISKTIKEKYEAVGLAVARALIANDEFKSVVQIDNKHFKYKKHFHIQVDLV